MTPLIAFTSLVWAVPTSTFASARLASPVSTPSVMSATTDGVCSANMRCATVFVRSVIVVTSAVCSSSTRSSGRAASLPVIAMSIVVAVRSGKSTPASLSFSLSSALSSVNFCCSSAAYGRDGAAMDVGNWATRASCSPPPACARKPTRNAGASVVPIERTSESVASAELDSSGGVRSSIM